MEIRKTSSVRNQKTSAISGAGGAGRRMATSKFSSTGESFIDSLQSLIGGGGEASALENEVNSYAPASIDSLATLLALQGVNDGNQQPNQRSFRGGDEQVALQKGQNILDSLRKLQQQILAGEVSVDDLSLIAKVTAETMPEISDDSVRQILHDIEVRARVELAKFSRVS